MQTSNTLNLTLLHHTHVLIQINATKCDKYDNILKKLNNYKL